MKHILLAVILLSMTTGCLTWRGIRHTIDSKIEEKIEKKLPGVLEAFVGKEVVKESKALLEKMIILLEWLIKIGAAWIAGHLGIKVAGLKIQHTRKDKR